MNQHKTITNAIPFFLLFIATAFAAMQIEYFIGNYFTMMAVVCTVLIILCCILNFLAWEKRSILLAKLGLLLYMFYLISIPSILYNPWGGWIPNEKAMMQPLTLTYLYPLPVVIILAAVVFFHEIHTLRALK
ncbi:hypothetical protein OBV_38320 [Oscillibacter valericigenes Sjm18-20]|nr:hypothetical protein OBV_38320 [Oscillibacter valericigenes Sjm18-20]